MHNDKRHKWRWEAKRENGNGKFTTTKRFINKQKLGIYLIKKRVKLLTKPSTSARIANRWNKRNSGNRKWWEDWQANDFA